MAPIRTPAGMRWQRVPGHHAQYGTHTNADGEFWIWFHCPRCGDVSKKLCFDPARTNYWVLLYCDTHAHGLVRRVR